MSKIVIVNKSLSDAKALKIVADLLVSGIDWKPCQINEQFFSASFFDSVERKKHIILCTKRGDVLDFVIRGAEVGE